MSLRAVGFCGADDSVHPNQLVILSNAYPFIEWGVLFRPDKEGTPRYASLSWVQTLATVVKNYNTTNNNNAETSSTTTKIKLAAHLCERRVNEVLDGDGSFIEQLANWGFGRVQINATAVNGVDTSRLGESTTIINFLNVVQQYPQLGFILQKNEETRPLWEGILNLDEDESLQSGKVGYLPSNVSMLLDESKGTGVLSNHWPSPPTEYEIGYAGGIGPNNIVDVLQKVHDAAKSNRTVWIDMESRLRSTKDGVDVFDLDKCYKVIQAVCDDESQPHHSHPSCLL